MSGLPKDSVLLLSVINMKLRDCYSSLDALCDDLEEDKADVISRLSAIGYNYDEGLNQFV